MYSFFLLFQRSASRTQVSLHTIIHSGVCHTKSIFKSTRQPQTKLSLISYNSINQVHPEYTTVHLLTPMVRMVFPSLHTAILSGVSLRTNQPDFFYGSKDSGYFSLPPQTRELILAPIALHHRHLQTLAPLASQTQ